MNPKTNRGKFVRDAATPKQGIPSKSVDQYDSKLEARYSRYLDCLLFCKEIRRYIYHPFTVKLAPKRTYTPDFLIEWKDGSISIMELKGSDKQKNARDSITRLHVATAKFPMWAWAKVKLVKGQWLVRAV